MDKAMPPLQLAAGRFAGYCGTTAIFSGECLVKCTIVREEFRELL